MTVAETNQIFYVVVERPALLRTAIAVRAASESEAESFVLGGGGLDVGYIGHQDLDGDTKVLYVDDEAPFGVFVGNEELIP